VVSTVMTIAVTALVMKGCCRFADDESPKEPHDG